MAQRVARRRRGSKPRAVNAEQRRAQQQRVGATIRAGIAQVVQQSVEGALQAEVTALLGRAKYARRQAAPAEAAAVRCEHCGQAWRPRLRRAGSYPRTLLTSVAAVRVRVPRVGCRCGGTVRVAFTTITPYVRSWGDVEERARELAGLCLSLQDMRQVLAWSSGQPVACSTLQHWEHQAATLAEAVRQGPLGRVPPVVQLDGVWVKLLVPTGKRYQDRQGRDRPRVRRRKAVLLVAYAVDPVTGERWILDWEQAEAEDEASWVRLLERLRTRGLSTVTGFTLFIHDGGSGLDAALNLVDFGPGVLRQRCLFHVLQNVRDAVKGEGLPRAAKRERRRELLQDAAAIWAGGTRPTLQRARQAFVAKWREREPTAVATLERSFGATLAYLEAQERGRERGEHWEARYLRTTSALERVNRALRRKARQVGAFQAEQGLTAALGLVIARLHLRRDAPPHELWTEVLEQGLLAA